VTSRRFDPLVDLFVGGGWTDISARVRHSNGIRISTGAQELATAVSSSCTMTLDNRSGDFSPRNPMGTYYGSLKRNTPIRVGTRIARDLYTSRAASNGWGATSQGVPAAWTWVTSGGSATDFGVTAGVGTHTLATAASRFTYLSAMDISNVEQRVTFQLPFANVTGGNILVKLVFRGVGGAWYRAAVTITAAEAIQLQAYDDNGSALGSPVTIAGLTHTGQQLRLAAHMDGEQLRAKIWPAASTEPYDWQLEHGEMGVAKAQPSHGWLGIETEKAAGNSNGSFAISFTNYEVISRLFCGEVSEWPPKPDISGNDITTTIEASGVLRRHRAGGNPIRSAAYRALSTAPGLVAYWSGEDGTTAEEFAASDSDWPSMAILSGKPRLASDSIFAASQPLPVVAGSIWEGLVNGYSLPSPNVIQLRWIQRIDISSAEPPNGATVIRLKNTGTAYFYILRYVTGGQLLLEVQDYFGNILDSDTIALESRNVGGRGSLLLQQSGANVNWTVSLADVDTQTVQSVSGSTAGQTIGMLGGVAVGDGGIDDVTMAHITAQTVASNPLDYAEELYAWQGETAPNRFLRVLGTEEGLPVQQEGDYDVSLTMGGQPIAAPMDFLDETAKVDQGMVWEPHFHSGIGYITYGALSNRAPRLTLDYAQQQLFDDLEIVDDDRYTANSVTVQKGNTSNSTGSKATRIQTTGPLAAVPPEDGGVGLYEITDQANVFTLDEAQQLAGFLLMKGTLDEPRIPQASVLLHSPRFYSSSARLLAALDMREGSFLSVQNMPVEIAADSIKALAVGVEHRLTQVQHEITWYTSPGDVYTVAEVSDGVSRVQAGELFLNANVTTTSTTSISVKSLDGTLLSTTAVPYDIEVGGEQMTATAVVGASSPQTVTVVRGVNRVVKTHTANDSENARVRIYHPARVALV
jgi:hypothetical protein